MIEKAIIEALASLGTGNAPRFQWSADALSLKDCIDGLAINRMRLPRHCEESESDALLALAMGLHYTKVKTTRIDLPAKAMRRVAALSMHFGAMIAEVAHIHDRKVAALLVSVLNGQDVTSDKPSMQNLLVAASCASKLPPGRFPDIEVSCQGLLVSAGSNQQILEMVGKVMDSVQTAEVTKDYADIAAQLFPDVGGECSDQSDDETESEESVQIDDPRGNATPSSDAYASGEPQDTALTGEASGIGQEQDSEGNQGDPVGASDDAGAGLESQEPVAKAERIDVPVESEERENSNYSQQNEADDALNALTGMALSIHSEEQESESNCKALLAGITGDSSKRENLVQKNGDFFAKNQNLVSEILRMLQSLDKRHNTLERQGRRISTKHVWRLKKLGDTKIFKHTTKVVGSQVAVEILVDGSGSMGAGLKVACEVSISFCDALQRLPKSSSAVSIFSGDVGVSEVVKEHGESVHKVRSKLSFITASGGTPTGAAILKRLVPLMAQRQERKLMVIITDGQARNTQVAQAAVLHAEALGVEIIGIGIGVHGKAIKTFIPEAITINNLGELQGALRRSLQNQVLA
ncbi:VWA domain-containing protein [Comamonas sp. w2-DMI]|uniref:VWA domain-containing protein n=1 Tax=Comamonas sp. w2-DMI TaxID=3126391 RepID=UPI0032E48FD8